MSAAALALLLLAQPASQPASQPNLPGGGRAADVTGTVTVILEVDEHRLKTQESWSLSNASGKSVAPSELVFELPDGSRRLALDEDVPGFVAAEDGSRFFADRPLGAGVTTVAGAYMWDFDGDTAVASRRVPVNVNGMRLIIEDIDGLNLTSNLEFQRRVRELNGLNFAIFDFSPLKAGQRWELRISGLPSHSTMPRTVATAAAIAIVIWAVLALVKREDSEEQTYGPLSARARRDQIVKALEILERDRAAEKVKPKRYERRHGELMASLATVLREIELAEARRRGG